MKKLLLLLTVFAVTTVFAQSPDCKEWQLKTDEGNYKVYTRACKSSSIKEFKVLDKFPGDFKKIIEIFNDVESNKKLSESCVESRLLSRPDEHTHLEYVRYKMPSGVRDRDIISHVTTKTTDSTFSLQSNAVDDKSVDRKKGTVRLTNARTSFFFKKKSDGTIEMEYIAFADPNGFDPAFIVNSLTKKEARMLVDKLKVLVK